MIHGEKVIALIAAQSKGQLATIPAEIKRQSDRTLWQTHEAQGRTQGLPRGQLEGAAAGALPCRVRCVAAAACCPRLLPRCKLHLDHKQRRCQFALQLCNHLGTTSWQLLLFLWEVLV